MRTLRGKHLAIDPKTGVPVRGTLSKFGDYLIRRYLEMRGVELHPEAILFLMRTGVPFP